MHFQTFACSKKKVKPITNKCLTLLLISFDIIKLPIVPVTVCVLPELFCNAALCLLYYALDKMGSLSCFVGHAIGQLLAHTCPLDDPRAGRLCRLQHGLSLLLPNTSQPDTPLRTEQWHTPLHSTFFLRHIAMFPANAINVQTSVMFKG